MTRPIEVIGRIGIPGSGNFDHAAVHLGSGRVFVAHAGSSTIEVLDPDAMAYPWSGSSWTGGSPTTLACSIKFA